MRPTSRCPSSSDRDLHARDRRRIGKGVSAARRQRAGAAGPSPHRGGPSRSRRSRCGAELASRLSHGSRCRRLWPTSRRDWPIVDRLPPSAERDNLELSLREPLHSARLRWRGWAAPEVGVNATAILWLAPATAPTAKSADRAVGDVDQHDHAGPRRRDTRLGSTPARGGQPEPGTSTCRSSGTAPCLSSHFYLGRAAGGARAARPGPGAVRPAACRPLDGADGK